MPGFQIFGGACGVQGGANGPSATTETARLHRFEFTTLGPLGGILLYAHRSGRPGPDIDVVTVHHSQDEVYTPGKNRWKPIEITFYEAANGNDQVASAIFQWWSQSILNIGASLVNGSPKQNASLSLLDGFGGSVWSYNMYGCWVPKVDPSTLDYSDTNIAEITFTLQYDKASEG